MTTPATMTMKIFSVVAEIAAERQRQITKEGWSVKHDDDHRSGDLAVAASCYALSSTNQDFEHETYLLWPWEEKYFKPKSEREDLIRAAALIVAEIERLDRRKQTNVSE